MRWLLRPRGWAVVLASLVLLWQAPRFLWYLRPPHRTMSDFFQDWASARDLLGGRLIYTELSETVERYLGRQLPPDLPAWVWQVNAHPPPAVLLIVPLAWLDYPDAFLVWNLLSCAALAGSLAIVFRQLHIGIPAWAILPVLAFLVVCPPLRQQVLHGQSNLLLLLLLCITWAAARQAKPWGAGLALAAATAIKLFPGLLIVYFGMRRQCTVVAAAVAGFAVVTALTVAAEGSQAYYSYVAEVLPRVGQFRSHWRNASMVGMWFKLFDPSPRGGPIVPLWQNPTLAWTGTVVSWAALVGVVAWVARRACTRAERDLAFGLAVIGMLLVSPLTWDHYFLLLLLPLAIMWVRLPVSGAVRWLWFSLVGALLLPPHWVWKLLIARGATAGIGTSVKATPVQTLTALSFQCYALVGLFVLAIVWETWAVSGVLDTCASISGLKNE